MPDYVHKCIQEHVHRQKEKERDGEKIKQKISSIK